MHGPKLGTLEESNIFDYTNPDHQIEDGNEDPGVREIYEAELADTGIDSRMPEEAYTEADYEFALSD
jgi:hypothetical protein